MELTGSSGAGVTRTADRVLTARSRTPLSGHTKALRTVVPTHGDLVDAQIATTNQLAALLDAHWPGAKTIFANIESAIALTFLTADPTASSAVGLTEKRPAEFGA
jgi:hypothetical protein